MRTALLDPEDPGSDHYWYLIRYTDDYVTATCCICGVGFQTADVTQAMVRVMLCGIGHLMAGRKLS